MARPIYQHANSILPALSKPCLLTNRLLAPGRLLMTHVKYHPLERRLPTPITVKGPLPGALVTFDLRESVLRILSKKITVLEKQ